MRDFAAIDFETANGKRSSVCSVGVVIVRGGEIVDKIYRLIKPSPNYYAWFCQQVHGLSEKDTCNADTFPEVWAEIAPRIEGLPLVAHNAPFDSGCLKAAHEQYKMDYPDYTFNCTLAASRKIPKKILQSHKLSTVAAHCGYEIPNQNRTPS